MKTYILILISSLSSLPLLSQNDSLLVTKNFKFNDGVYLSFEAFQQNRPDYTWEQAEGRMVTNADTYLTKIEWLRTKDSISKQHLPLAKVWGVCVGGIPFIKTPIQHPEYVLFSALRVRGKICYFAYEEEAIEQVVISAYNPLTGKPFRSGKVNNKVYRKVEKMLAFNDGQIETFTSEHFMAWIADDPKLVKTVEELSQDEIQEKLFKCLLIYVDRNPVYIPTEKTQ